MAALPLTTDRGEGAATLSIELLELRRLETSEPVALLHEVVRAWRDLVFQRQLPKRLMSCAVQRVELGQRKTWFDYRARVERAGCDLPTIKQLREAGASEAGDAWVPITPSKGDVETGLCLQILCASRSPSTNQFHKM